MPIQNARDLFQLELSDMYNAEQNILKILPDLRQEIDNPEVKAAFEMHEQQTRQQVQNLDQVFQLLGLRRQQATCHAVLGLKQEHEDFKKEGPSKVVLTLFDLGAAAKTEHYEIASYQGLVDKAKLMGQQQVVTLLEQNLRQEQEMAQKVSHLAHQLGQQHIAEVMPQGQPGFQPTA